MATFPRAFSLEPFWELGAMQLHRSLIPLALAFAQILPSSALAASKDRYSDIHSVAVVSMLGNEIHLEKTGFTIFGNMNQGVEIAGWNADETIEGLIKAHLGDIEVKDIPFDKPRMANCPNSEACLSALPENANVDAFIVVISENTLGFGRDNWSGIGLYHASGITGRLGAVLHASYMIEIISAKNRQLLDYEEGVLPETVFGGEHSKPIKELDPTTWPGDAASMTPDQKETVRREATDLLSRSVPFTLARTGLVSP